jgi:hypothetical protein
VYLFALSQSWHLYVFIVKVFKFPVEVANCLRNTAEVSESAVQLLTLFRSVLASLADLLARNFSVVITGDEELRCCLVLCSVTLMNVLLVDWLQRAKLRPLKVRNIM